MKSSHRRAASQVRVVRIDQVTLMMSAGELAHPPVANGSSWGSPFPVKNSLSSRQRLLPLLSSPLLSRCGQSFLRLCQPQQPKEWGGGGGGVAGVKAKQMNNAVLVGSLLRYRSWHREEHHDQPGRVSRMRLRLQPCPTGAHACWAGSDRVSGFSLLDRKMQGVSTRRSQCGWRHVYVMLQDRSPSHRL